MRRGRGKKDEKAGEKLQPFFTLRLCIFLFGFLCEAIEMKSHGMAFTSIYSFCFLSKDIISTGCFPLRVF